MPADRQAHTPGPWLPMFGSLIRVMTSDGNSVCGVHKRKLHDNCSRMIPYDPSEVEANARLIAAAPELLAALKALISADNEPLVMTDAWSDKIMADARAAIAKAEGR